MQSLNRAFTSTANGELGRCDETFEARNLVFSQYREVLTETIYDAPKFIFLAISVSFFIINSLNSAHNQFAHEVGALKDLKTLGIEVGLFATSFILAPIEAITRLALWFILMPFALASYYALKDHSFTKIIASSLGFGTLLSLFSIANGALSLQTNLAYSNREIDYAGQVNKYLFCVSAKNEDSNRSDTLSNNESQNLEVDSLEALLNHPNCTARARAIGNWFEEAEKVFKLSNAMGENQYRLPDYNLFLEKNDLNAIERLVIMHFKARWDAYSN